MIKVEKIETYGWEAAIRGMRNPMNSWDKSDSMICTIRKLGDCKANVYKCPLGEDQEFRKDTFCIGKNDIALMQKLFKAGTEHRKFLRMIHVQMDITAPLYWLKEFDTYKVGTVSNSCSTMHKIQAKEFRPNDFSFENLTGTAYRCALEDVIEELNKQRVLYLDTKDKKYWWNMIQLLPSSYNQKRTVDFNYETVLSIVHQREGHKLDEWLEFVEILKDLPYIKEITSEEK